MSEKRFAIKPQDDYWAVIDNHNDDKVCIINGIHTEIEAIWLCDFMNEQQATINKLKEENEQLKEQVQILNKCCRHKSSDEYIKQAYADLNRREREKHSQGNATYIAKINQNEVIY